jgi:hypothetical protein
VDRWKGWHIGEHDGGGDEYKFEIGELVIDLWYLYVRLRVQLDVHYVRVSQPVPAAMD